MNQPDAAEPLDMKGTEATGWRDAAGNGTIKRALEVSPRLAPRGRLSL